MKTDRSTRARLGRGDDTVGNPYRAQISQFELFEPILSLKLDEQFPGEQFEPTVSHSTVSSPPLRHSPFVNSIIISISIISICIIIISISIISIINSTAARLSWLLALGFQKRARGLEEYTRLALYEEFYMRNLYEEFI